MVFSAAPGLCYLSRKNTMRRSVLQSQNWIYMQWMYRGRHVRDNKRMNDFVKEYLETQRLEAEYECRTAHKAIKRGAANYNEYERYEEELEQ